jgi:hypothetical protein
VLKYMYRDSPTQSDDWRDLNTVHPHELVNLNAILNAYRRKDIKVVDGQVTVWFAGKMVMGPLGCSKLEIGDLVENVSQWQKEYGPGRVWVEEVCRYRCPSTRSSEY